MPCVDCDGAKVAKPGSLSAAVPIMRDFRALEIDTHIHTKPSHSSTFMKVNKRFSGSILAAIALAAVSASAFGATEVLTFEGLGDQESINNYYNGGSGGNGTTGGPNYGISFTSDSLALISSHNGGSGSFSNNPSGDTIAFFLDGAGDTMNVADGFNTGFSFYYADQTGFTGSVNVFSGLNGTGTLLATLPLLSTPNPYSVFVPVGVTFAGSAKSVIFSGAANRIGFDDITLGSATPGSAVPDAGSTAALLGVAVSALGFLKRKLA